MNERLKTLRNELQLSQTKFAEKINMKRSSIASLEIGERKITDRSISDICRVFNVNEQWLRFGEGPMFRPQVNSDNELVAIVARIIGSRDPIDEWTKRMIIRWYNLTPEHRQLFLDLVEADCEKYKDDDQADEHEDNNE